MSAAPAPYLPPEHTPPPANLTPKRLAFRVVLPFAPPFLLWCWGQWWWAKDELLYLTLGIAVGLFILCGGLSGWRYRRQQERATADNWLSGVWAWAWLQLPCLLGFGLWGLLWPLISLCLLPLTLVAAAVGEALAARYESTSPTRTSMSSQAKRRELGQSLLTLLKFLYYLWKRPK